MYITSNLFVDLLTIECNIWEKFLIIAVQFCLITPLIWIINPRPPEPQKNFRLRRAWNTIFEPFRGPKSAAGEIFEVTKAPQAKILKIDVLKVPKTLQKHVSEMVFNVNPAPKVPKFFGLRPVFGPPLFQIREKQGGTQGYGLIPCQIWRGFFSSALRCLRVLGTF